MTTGGTRLPTEPHWRKLFEAAILELDLAKVRDRIEEVRKAIVTRVLLIQKVRSNRRSRIEN